MPTYEVVESKVWKRDDGQTASIYGACPWTNPTEKARWTIVQQGFTVRNNVRGTVGIGRKPWTTREAAQAWANAHA